MKKVIKKVINSKIEKVIAGGGNGSIILFELKGIQEESYIIYIYCTWRLLNKNQVLVGWNDNSEDELTNFVLKLKELEGYIITNFKINKIGDLKIVFNNNKSLEVFSDITSDNGKNEEENNWSICDLSENICYNLTNFFEIKKENYS